MPMESGNTSNDGQLMPQGFAPPPQGGFQSFLKRAAIWLQEISKIVVTFKRHPRFRRPVELNLQELFNVLRQHYYTLFLIYLPHLRHLVPNPDVPAEYINRTMEYLAAVYVSHWIHDLYVSNRRACYTLHDPDYNDYFVLDLVHTSDEYDCFLVALNASIRPTNIKLTHEDSLYIPHFGDDINTDIAENNYFNIQGWQFNNSHFYGLLEIIRDRKLFKLEKLVESANGRPCWLFDWHENLAYSWFPQDLNYNENDIALAYILGIACTSQLAPRDYDEWQYFPGNDFPAHIDVANYQRSRPLVYRGAVEVNTIVIHEWKVPNAILDYINVKLPQQPLAIGETSKTPTQQAKKQKKVSQLKLKAVAAGPASGTRSHSIHVEEQEGEGQNDEEESVAGQQPKTGAHKQSGAKHDKQQCSLSCPKICRYRIITYLYYRRLIDNTDAQTRHAAFRMIIKS